jgi:hypothetical protein
MLEMTAADVIAAEKKLGQDLIDIQDRFIAGIMQPFYDAIHKRILNKYGISVP